MGRRKTTKKQTKYWYRNNATDEFYWRPETYPQTKDEELAQDDFEPSEKDIDFMTQGYFRTKAYALRKQQNPYKTPEEPNLPPPPDVFHSNEKPTKKETDKKSFFNDFSEPYEFDENNDDGPGFPIIAPKDMPLFSAFREKEKKKSFFDKNNDEPEFPNIKISDLPPEKQKLLDELVDQHIEERYGRRPDEKHDDDDDYEYDIDYEDLKENWAKYVDEYNKDPKAFHDKYRYRKNKNKKQKATQNTKQKPKQKKKSFNFLDKLPDSSKITPTNGLMLGNYLANLLMSNRINQPIENTNDKSNDFNHQISALRYSLNNSERYKNEPRKTIYYNGEAIEIPISLLPDDRTFLEKHGNKLKNAAVAAGALGLLGYGAYKGYKLYDSYAKPVVETAIGGVKKVASTAETVITAPKKAVNAVGSGFSAIGNGISSGFKAIGNVFSGKKSDEKVPEIVENNIEPPNDSRFSAIYKGIAKGAKAVGNVFSRKKSAKKVPENIENNIESHSSHFDAIYNAFYKEAKKKFNKINKSKK